MKGSNTIWRHLTVSDSTDLAWGYANGICPVIEPIPLFAVSTTCKPPHDLTAAQHMQSPAHAIPSTCNPQLYLRRPHMYSPHVSHGCPPHVPNTRYTIVCCIDHMYPTPVPNLYHDRG